MRADTQKVDLIDSVTQKFQLNTLTKNILICLVGSLALSLSARIAFSLPFSPVPITAQTLVLLLISTSLGAKKATSTVTLYLFQGVMGQPVFAGGTFGLNVILGPTGGYLLGFLLCAFVLGKLTEKKFVVKFKTTLLLFLLGHTLIFLSGISWLVFYTGEAAILEIGLYPFIPGVFVKTLMAASLAPLIQKIIKKADT